VKAEGSRLGSGYAMLLTVLLARTAGSSEAANPTAISTPAAGSTEMRTED
jgi:hypothetical protein